MFRIRLIFIFVLLIKGNSYGQNSDDAFRKPLKQVLQDIEKKYQVQIAYPDSLVTGRWVTYAEWRYRNNIDTTIANILTPLDLKVTKAGEGKYKLRTYEYYRWNVKEGWAELDRIAAQYHNVAEWEQRKQQLRPCLLQALQLAPMPAAPLSFLHRFAGSMDTPFKT